MTFETNLTWRMTGCLILGGIVVVLCSLMVAQQGVGSGENTLDSIIDAMEKKQSEIRPQVSYVVIREYHLSGANSHNADSNVVAQVEFRPPSSRDYTIQKSLGSSRGRQVVRRILDEEMEASSNGRNAKTALNKNNYDFTYMGEAILDGQTCYRIGLKPKRKDAGLISGQAWLDKSSFLIRRIEGDLVKTPSWWLKRIHLKLSFADVEGTWLQTSMEAMADVRVVGPHTLTSRILDYRTTDVLASAGVPMRSPSKHTANLTTMRTTGGSLQP